MSGNKLSPILIILNIGASLYLIGRVVWYGCSHIRQVYNENQRRMEGITKSPEEVQLNKVIEDIKQQMQDATMAMINTDASKTERRIDTKLNRSSTKQSISIHAEGTVKQVTVNEVVDTNTEEQLTEKQDDVRRQVFTAEDLGKLEVIIESKRILEKKLLVNEESKIDTIDINFKKISSKEINTGNKEGLEVIHENELLELDNGLSEEHESNSENQFPKELDWPIENEETPIENLEVEHQPLENLPPKEPDTVMEDGSPQNLDPLKEKLLNIFSKHLIRDNVQDEDLGIIQFQFQLSDLKYPSFLELGPSEIKLIKDSYKRQELKKRLISGIPPEESKEYGPEDQTHSTESQKPELEDKSIDSGFTVSVSEEKPPEAESNEVRDKNSTTFTVVSSKNTSCIDNEDEWEDMEDEAEEFVGDLDEETTDVEPEQRIPLPFEVRDLMVSGRLIRVAPSDSQVIVGSQGDMATSSGTSVHSYEYAESY